MLPFVWAFSLVLLLVACAPQSRFPDVDPRMAEIEARKQRIETVKAQLESEARLFKVSHTIMTSNAALCGEKVHEQVGYMYYTLGNFSDEWVAAAKHLGITEHWTVIAVVEGSPAALAGIRKGDNVLQYSRSDTGEYTYTVERGNAKLNLTAKPVASCAYPVKLLLGDQRVNAFADGNHIYLTAGMLWFAQTDAELALIVGHELAHNTRGHIASKMGNQLLGTLLGASLTVVTGINVTDLGTQLGGSVFSQEFEAEADYVGVYYAARAGYDVASASSIWRRMAVQHPGSINLHGSTHPSTAKRFLAIEAAVKEVRTKMAAGLSLAPEERKQ